MTTDTTVELTPEQWVERCNSLAPLVAQYRDEAEFERHLPEPVVEAMREQELFCTWMPKSLGGHELTIETSVMIMEALSRLDGSVGWNSMISSNHSILWSHIEHDLSLIHI